MNAELTVLIASAATIGFLHTILGPDHYLPFVALSKARNWKFGKTLFITAISGLGHVLSSVVLGMIGILAGLALNKLELFESVRGNIAGWLLLAFGLTYMVWGIVRAVRNKPHRHIHVHEDGIAHDHEHVHQKEHLHTHDKQSKKNGSAWIIFIIFLFGPCEPLIPLLMYPAAKSSLTGSILVASVFSIVTIATMIAAVTILTFGVKKIHLPKIERFSHAIAGFVIFSSGFAIQVLGL